jgi:hypothetical protein
METLAYIAHAAARWVIELFRGWRLDLAEGRAKDSDHE